MSVSLHEDRSFSWLLPSIQGQLVPERDLMHDLMNLHLDALPQGVWWTKWFDNATSWQNVKANGF